MMPPLEIVVAVVMLVALTIYALLGGADYGGGVWDLLARGPRAAKQRELVANAIGPIWEANHVWLILVVVLMFACFPPAFARISIALHIPIALMLIGIVLRGSAFTFRTYDAQVDQVQRRWGRMFAIPSMITPILLGVILGAVSMDLSTTPSHAVEYYFRWVSLFPFAVGLFALILFAFLAAVYLTAEAGDRLLQDDFRFRAMVAELAAGGLALLVFLVAPEHLRGRLAGSWWTWPLQLVTAVLALSTLAALWTRRFTWARITAAGQVTLILWGWGLSQYPYLVRPEVTIQSAAAPEVTLRLVLQALAAGSVVLIPSYWYLLRAFKSSRTLADPK
jgi:cytochrome d ubiquinol oxidase subunit II